ncbi:MAG: penicillin-insensitive murein endopeptidase, partial [Nannocystaceae bacterium]
PESTSVGVGHPTLAPQLEPIEHPRWIRHHRAPRETLQQIAARYGVAEAKLREWNGLGPDDPAPQRRKRLRVWAQRMPPPRAAVEYEVVEGDTWWGVALRHGVEPRDLRGYNWPWKKKMQPGAKLEVWIDPVVHDWIAAGPDPLPPDLAHGFRRGAVSIGSPNTGVLVNGLRIPEVPGLHLRMPRSSYGTSHAVEHLLLGLERFRERTDYPDDIAVGIGSMSLPRGGRIGGHLSHRSGRDVDIKLLRRPDVSPWREIQGSRVQWSAVWDLVMALSELDVMVIFLDQGAQARLFRAARRGGATPQQLATGRRLIEHSPGHEHHLHVRFGCGPYETECVP